jgi:hypothetical protein
MIWRAAGFATVIVAAGLFLSGCSSTPFSNASDFDRTFIGAAQTWDIDKDGTVSCDEWKQYSSTSLREADGNGDGALDQTEFTIMAKSDRLFEVANFAYYDLNSDGRVTADELVGKPNLAFKLLDKNGDCRIDRNETVLVVGNEKPKEKAKDVDQQIPKPGGR